LYAQSCMLSVTLAIPNNCDFYKNITKNHH
jgi:hypothetical protein